MLQMHGRQVPVEEARRDLKNRLDGLFGSRGENIAYVTTVTIVARYLADLTRQTALAVTGRREPAAEVMARIALDETPLLISLGEVVEQIKIIHPTLTGCELIMLLTEYQLDTARFMVRQERGE